MRRQDDAVEQALDEPQERQLEQEEADVAAEDRVGDARRRRERDSVQIEQDRLPCPRHGPADEQGDEQRDAAEDPAGERGEIRHVAGLEGDRLAVPEPVAPAAKPLAARIAPVVGCLGGFVDAVHDRAERPGALGGWRRGKASGQPDVAEQDDGGDQEGRDPEPQRRDDARPEDRVEPDALEPQGIGPQVDPDAEQQEDGDDGDDDRVEPETPAGPRGSARGAVIGAARRAPWRSAAAASLVVERPGTSEGIGLVGVVVVGVGVQVRHRRRRRRRPRGPRVSVSSSAASGSGSESRSRRAPGAGSSPRAAASRFRSSSMKSSKRSRIRDGV